MRVVQLWRYPVKSLQGEQVERVVCGERGFVGDRAWGLRDLDTDVVLSAKKVPPLFQAAARLVGDGPVLDLPDGVMPDDAGLSAWLGRRVALVAAAQHEAATYEIPADFEDDASEVLHWQGPPGTFHDSTRTHVHLASLGSFGSWDVRRFRPNVVVDGIGEADLVGRVLMIGTAEFDVVKQTERCVMTTRAQRGGVERDLDVLRTLLRERDGNLGIALMVRQPGSVAVGDEVRALDTMRADPT